MINSIFFSRSLKGRCYGNRFLARIGENWHSSPSFNALAFHNGWEDGDVDARVNTANDPSTLDKTLMKFSPITPEFCGRVCAGGLTLGFATHLVLLYCIVECDVQTAEAANDDEPAAEAGD